MAQSYDLTQFDPTSFEHMANFLALKVLGAGHTSFGPGPDGGRDGLFQGEAPYPSPSDCWSGRWYIQAKFHKPHLSTDPQGWLLAQIKQELQEFRKTDTQRDWPDNWIIITNIDPSGTPHTGAFDRAKQAVAEAHPGLESHFDIWGGRKVLDLLASHPEIKEYYFHFLTPGHVLHALYNAVGDTNAGLNDILRYLIVTRFVEQQFTKLEQAGFTADSRPGIHRLFTDLPFQSMQHRLKGMAAEYLARSAGQNHRINHIVPDSPDCKTWQLHPARARVWFIKGGQGKVNRPKLNTSVKYRELR
jgi:hypothetical protein